MLQFNKYLTAAKTDIIVHTKTIWEIPVAADSAIDGHPDGGAPPSGKYITAGPDMSGAGLVAVLLNLSLWCLMHSDSSIFDKRHDSIGLWPNWN